MAGNTMGEFEWARHEERIAAMPGVVDVGVGRDAVQATGLSTRELGALFRELFHDLIDGGANVVEAFCPNGVVRIYVRRRGRSVDLGTRKDFETLGWDALCDRLDNPGAAT